MNEAEARRAVIAEARRWIGTPYHHMAQVKGAGVDCAMFPAAVYAAAGVIAPPKVDFYPPDWHLHRGAERYLDRVAAYAAEVGAPAPGDFVLWRIGRVFAHGAIIVAWPRIVHPVVGIGVIEDDGEAPTLAFGRQREGKRPRKFFSPWRNNTRGSAYTPVEGAEAERREAKGSQARGRGRPASEGTNI